ncbi:MAG TPA: hypothetical protein VKG05_12720 [Steroidobacteraceae bacterium]|nr:hypothetical protein [Steroidobacteraceae bacterium]
MNTTAASLDSAHSKAKLATRRMHWPFIWTAVVVGLLCWGYYAHLERYISPQRGLGYWLGIVGGSMMVLLLMYSARKRAAWLKWLGSIPAWFEIHMTLGIVGPILVLFHSNFKLGATNSNVALVCMLVVAGSGVIGRYIYTRLHARMDDHEVTLGQLKAVGERLRTQAASISFLPSMLDAIDRIERRWIDPPKGPAERLLHLLSGGPRLVVARWLVRYEINRTVKRTVRGDSALSARHVQRIGEAARSYAARRLEAGRRMAEYRLYAQLFSLWHVLHIPLFFMLLIAGVTHVIAVNVY